MCAFSHFRPFISLFPVVFRFYSSVKLVVNISVNDLLAAARSCRSFFFLYRNRWMVMGALDNGTHPITKGGLGKEFPCHSYRRVSWIWGACGSAAIFPLSNQTTDNNLHILDLYTEKREQNDEPKRKKNVNAFSMVSWKLWRSIKIEWLDPFIDVLTCNFFHPAFIGTATAQNRDSRWHV